MQKTRFYSDSEEFLQGMESGIMMVGDTELTVSDVMPSDNGKYKFMLVLDDEGVEEDMWVNSYFNGTKLDYQTVEE